MSRQQRKKIEIEPSHSDGLQLVQISWKKRKLFTYQKDLTELPQEWFETQTWPPFHCFETPIW